MLSKSKLRFGVGRPEHGGRVTSRLRAGTPPCAGYFYQLATGMLATRQGSVEELVTRRYGFERWEQAVGCFESGGHQCSSYQ